jgi:hypothetical protein
VSGGLESTVGVRTASDTWRHPEHRTLVTASVAKATNASVAPEKRLVKGQMAIFVCGAINRSGDWPWL